MTNDAPCWRKASRSNQSGGDCVEIADNIPGVVAVRDSKDPDGPALVFEPTAFAAFVDATRHTRLTT